MPISDLIPWKKNKGEVSTEQRPQEDSLLTIRDEMNRMFDEFFERPFGLSPFSERSTLDRGFVPSMDVSETDKEINVKVELPGLEADDVDVTIGQNSLTISGEKRVEKEEEGERYYRAERSYGSFQRVIPLPEGVERENVDASFRNGVLSVKIPKSKEVQKSSKQIPIKTR
jgi:HSP20 family protein